MTIQFNKLIP